jgi:hypothetical protein
VGGVDVAVVGLVAPGQGVILHVAEFELVFADQVDGAGVGVGDVACLKKDPVKQGVDVLDVVEGLGDVVQIAEDLVLDLFLFLPIRICPSASGYRYSFYNRHARGQNQAFRGVFSVFRRRRKPRTPAAIINRQRIWAILRKGVSRSGRCTGGSF